MKTYFNLAQGCLITIMFTGVMGRGYASSPEDYLEREMPATWDLQANCSSAQLEDDEWWRIFDDSMLDSLVAMGIDNNYNLAIASSRINVARNTMKSVQSGYFPSISLEGSWTKSRTSGMTGIESGKAVGASYFDLGLNLNWQIDLFGKITSQTKEKNAMYKASKAEYAGAMLTLVSTIASNYFQLRVWQAELQVAKEHAENQRKVVDIAEARFECELASKLDVTQAREVYYNTLSTIPVLENSIHTAINSLAILVGVYPEEIVEGLLKPVPLPDCHILIPVGIPADLIRRRPDIVESEQQLAAEAYALGVAKKDFLPTLTINGSIGTTARNVDNLFNKQSVGYSVVPTLSWTLFDGLQRNYNKNIAREQLQMGIDSYNMAVMNAVQDVDNAMSSYRSALLHMEAIKRVMEQSDESLKLSIDLYKNSLTQFSNVVDAQMNVLENQNSLIVSHGQALNYIIQIFEAIGGGWNESIIQ